MMKHLTTLVIALASISAFAQSGEATGDPGAGPQIEVSKPKLVSISAKGADVRGVIHDLFTQAKQSYVLQPGVQFALFLSLENFEFEQALHIVCRQAGLRFEIDNAVYYVSRAKPTIAPAIPPAPKGMLDKTVLARTLSLKVAKTDIRLVFAEIGKQTGVKLEVDKAVPAFKLDCTLTKATLHVALDKITQATNLKYRLTEESSILIFKPEEPNHVGISGG